MPGSNVHHIISEFKTCTLTDQLYLLEEMASLIRQNSGRAALRKISELQGKGKELWDNVDVKNYLDEERNSWNG